MDAPHVEFESNLEDAVDANLRYFRRSKSSRSWRRNAMTVVGMAGGLTVFLSFWIGRGDPEALELIVVAVLGALFGIALAFAYGPYYDRALRRRLGRLLQEQLGDAKSFSWRIELRPEGAWSKARNIEVLLPWNELVDVEDAPYGVAMWFRGGFVVARDRGFATPAQREVFLERARELGAAPVPAA